MHKYNDNNILGHTQANTIKQLEPPWHLIRKHPRVLSDFNSNKLEIDVTHSAGGKKKIWSCDLGELRVARLGHVSPHGADHYMLQNFPELMMALKAAINSMLFARTDMIADCAAGLINHSLRLFSWMIHRNIFKFSQFSPEDATDLLEGWRHNGWWTVLNYDDALKAVLKIAKNNANVAHKLSGLSNAEHFSVDSDAVIKMTGLPISSNFIPVDFAQQLSAIVDTKRVNPKRTARSTKMTQAAYARLMVETNRFSSFPVELGAIPFLPFSDANKTAERVFPSPKGRTKNISIDNSLKIVGEALRWLTEYKNFILNTASAARSALEQTITRGTLNSSPIQKAIAEEYSKQTLGFANAIPGISTMSTATLAKCIETLMTACFCLIAINHGRRRNEIIGHNKPYGLYFGCIQEISNVYDDWRIDIYIQKSSRAYLSFWCNDIVRDAVSCLEEVSQIFRPLFAERKTYPTNRRDGRGDKLFYLRSFTKTGFESPPKTFEFGSHACSFFELAGVDESYFKEKAHPFRRIFACIFKHRYDIPKSAALTQYYDHDMSSITEVYYTDSPGTSPADGVEALYGRGYGKEMASLRKVMEEVTSEYFVEVMQRLLKGELIGGNFAKLALKLMHRISSSIKFQQLAEDEKAELLSTTLMRRGYSLTEKEHAICCATDKCRTLRRSNCFVDGEFRPENASPRICGSCVHLLTTEGYRRGLIDSLDELAKQSADFSLPPAVRHQIKKDHAALKAFIEADERVAAANQSAISALTENWNKVFFV